MKISIIVAVASNNVIGKDNDLIWRLPSDMKFFREKTTGHHVLTGRKNYESIPEKYRPLPNRTNLIISRNKKYSAEGARVFSTIQQGIDFASKQGEEELFIIGGAQVYEQTIDQADVLYVTEVHHQFDGDAFFSEIDLEKWELSHRENHSKNDVNPYDFSFCTYIRKEGI